MSNNLVSQPLPIPNQQMGQLEPISSKLDSSIPGMLMGTVGPVFSNTASQQTSLSNQQVGAMKSMFSNHGPEKLSIGNRYTGQIESREDYLGAQQFLIPNKELEGMEASLNNLGQQQISMPNKRKALIEPMSNDPLRQQVVMPNKRVTQVEHRPWLQQLSSGNVKNVQMQSMSNFSGPQQSPPPNKRAVQMVSVPNKPRPHQLSNQKNQTTQMQPSSKVQNESLESVRSKLRESLAGALSLVTQRQEKPSNTSESATTSGGQNQEDSQSSKSDLMVAHAPDQDSEKPKETSSSKDDFDAQKNDNHNATQATLVGENTGDPSQTWKCNGQGFQLNPLLPEDDVSFSDNLFVKDELLQGNGLTWAMDIDTEVAEKREVECDDKQRLDHKEAGQKKLLSPEVMAFKIESELFKLFGGVNKKYKEKGRSLLFNLKDRNNPELRERVMSGEIPPEQLCSMTAEELASKELSEWRIAKAEELAQMVVLPDSEVDIRRLVKKTHKGEFQVEVDQDDSVSVEVSVGASSLPQIRPKANEKEAHPHSKPDKKKADASAKREKNNSEDQDTEYTLTIPPEGADLMQGLIVDELKDAEFLPPIVSLDEFMESLDSEPPFQNLPLDAGKTTSDKDRSEVKSDSKSPDSSPKKHVGGSSNKPDGMDVKDSTSGSNVKSTDSPIESSVPSGASNDENVWEGLLQLNPSTNVTVIAFFRSGEKTSTKEWPSVLEVKGRVRREAFEKFLQELPMSRSRALMVVDFALKKGSAESDSENVREVADSYVSDERVGFAEPAPGMELYFCPPHLKTLEMFRKHLPKDHTDALNSTTSNNGLIGVVVWRRALISPNSSSHHNKHSLKKLQHSTSRRHQEKDVNANVNFTSKPLRPNSQPPPPDNDDDDDDDDVPPGFGPPANRDDDDLPEFNFSSSSNPSVTQASPRVPGMSPVNSLSQNPYRPVDQVRQLIHKYGQPGTNSIPRSLQDKRGFGVAAQPWNDDDDDDIPEWQPQVPQQLTPTPQPPSQLPAHSFQQPHLGVAQPLYQPILQSLQPQMNVMQLPQNVDSSRQQSHWGASSFSPQGYPSSQPSGGQFYVSHQGSDPRKDVSRSRGF